MTDLAPSGNGPRKLRWGLLGAAEIARKNYQAIVNSGNGLVAAVASRDRERARRFVETCQAEVPGHPRPVIFDHYADLLVSDQVDAVYVPLPTGPRKEWVLKAAAAGKHVVCEKPCAVTVADLEEMITACRRYQVQFMDGVMFVHSQRLQRMGEILRDRSVIGPLRRIASGFSFLAPREFAASNIRARSELEPQGCLGDLGWYCVRLSLWAMDWVLPERATGRIQAEMRGGGSAAPVPAEFTGELQFAQGVSASFYCSFLTENQQWAVLSGERGYLQVPDFVLPFAGPELAFEVYNSAYAIKGCDFSMSPGRRRVVVNEWSHSHANAQESRLFRAFAEQVLSGKRQEHWIEQALKTQQVICACLQSALQDGRPVKVAG